MHFRCKQGFFFRKSRIDFSKRTFPVSRGGSNRTIFGDCIVTILESWPAYIVLADFCWADVSINLQVDMIGGGVLHGFTVSLCML